MAQHGGARNRSGPRPVEGSASSDRRGYVLTALPSEGYTGPAPEFPLLAASDRELEVWDQLWSTPQACAWSLPSESWRLRDIAMYARVSVRCEDPDVSPSVMAQLHRLGDRIGMSTAGLAEMGWKVAVDEVAAKRGTRKSAKKTATPPVRRMRPPADATAG
jgi:hypothetical protein